MSVKAIIVLCAQTLLANVAFSQCVRPGGEYLRALSAPSVGAESCGALGGNGPAYGAGFGYGAGLGYGDGHGYGAGLGYGFGNGYAGAGLSAASIEVTPTSGGALPISSSSTIAPSGLSVSSENSYAGDLRVIGELPFLSAIALEGVLPSAGAGVVNYGCGNGVTAITSDAGYSAGAYGIGSAGIGSGATGYGSSVAAIAPAAGLGLTGRGCGCGGY